MQDELIELLVGAESRPIPIPRDCTDGFTAAFWARPEASLTPTLARISPPSPILTRASCRTPSPLFGTTSNPAHGTEAMPPYASRRRSISDIAASWLELRGGVAPLRQCRGADRAHRRRSHPGFFGSAT